MAPLWHRYGTPLWHRYGRDRFLAVAARHLKSGADGIQGRARAEWRQSSVAVTLNELTASLGEIVFWVRHSPDGTVALVASLSTVPP